MGLKELINQKFLKEVLGCTESKRKVLICDEISTNIISSICIMKNIMDTGVSTVLSLKKKRQPIKCEAIYIIEPSEESIALIIRDFEKPERPTYLAAHVFIIKSIDKTLIQKFKDVNLLPRLHTLSECHLFYKVSEGNIFSLAVPFSYSDIYSNQQKFQNFLENASSTLSSLCFTLNSIPNVIWQTNSQRCESLAQRVLGDVKSIPQQNSDSKTTIILLERNFDGMTPLMHELTLQAMAGDLLNLNSNVYSYKNISGVDTNIVLDDSIELWSSFRYQHIADVLKVIPQNLKDLAQQNKMKLTSNKSTIQDLKSLISKLPQYKAELNKYQVLLSMSEKCYQLFEKNGLENLCKIEQDMATGVDKNGDPVVDPLLHMMPILQGNYSAEDKIRVILLYALSQPHGIHPANLDKMLEHGKIKNEKEICKRFTQVGLCVLEGDASSKSILRKQEYVEGAYSLSRFTPILKSLLKDICNYSLSQNEFCGIDESLFGKKAVNSTEQGGNDFKFGKWKNSETPVKSTIQNRKIIVFVIGGVTYSEIRCAYEIEKDKNVDIFIGGSELITPRSYLSQIKNL